jgi:hypothetical protein
MEGGWSRMVTAGQSVYSRRQPYTANLNPCTTELCLQTLAPDLACVAVVDGDKCAPAFVRVMCMIQIPLFIMP